MRTPLSRSDEDGFDAFIGESLKQLMVHGTPVRLRDVIDWIDDALAVTQVFDDDALDTWARNNGYHNEGECPEER